MRINRHVFALVCLVVALRGVTTVFNSTEGANMTATTSSPNATLEWTSPPTLSTPIPQPACKLPDCLAPSTAPPGGLEINQTPQIITVTFNDPITNHAYSTISKLFTAERKNANKKRISATIYVTHNNTKYTKVGILHKEGHEIACRSKTSRIPNDWWSGATYTQWQEEFQKYRKIMAKEIGIAETEIKGMRAPYFQPGGDNQFQMLHDNRFLYDSTLKAGPLDLIDPQIYPFTLDEGFPFRCLIPKCPPKGESYPGLWEIPIQPLVNKKTGLPCTFLQECRLENKEDAKEMLIANFERNYRSRTPFVLNLQANWLYANSFLLEAVDEFIDDVLARDDVWFVKSSQLISWMQKPTPIDELQEFSPWNPPEPSEKEEESESNSTKTKTNRTKPTGGFITWPWGNVDDVWFYEYIILSIALVIIILRDKARDD